MQPVLPARFFQHPALPVQAGLLPVLLPVSAVLLPVLQAVPAEKLPALQAVQAGLLPVSLPVSAGKPPALQVVLRSVLLPLHLTQVLPELLPDGSAAGVHPDDAPLWDPEYRSYCCARCKPQ